MIDNLLMDNLESFFDEENTNDYNDSIIVQSWTFENDATLE